MNLSERGNVADLPVQLPSSADLFCHVDNQQSRPVCYSAPPLGQRDVVGQSDHRHMDPPMIDGAAYFPPAVPSVGGPPLVNLQTGQRATSQLCSRDGVRRGQRDSNNVIVQGVASAAASTAVDTRRNDCFTGRLGGEQVRVCDHSGHDIKVATHPRSPTDLLQSLCVQGPTMGEPFVSDSGSNVVMHPGIPPGAVVRQPTVLRQPQSARLRDTCYSCPDIAGQLRPVDTGHWGATVTGNRQFQLPTVVEVGHAAAVNDTTVVMQPSAVTEIGQRQQYDAGDPPALVMASTEANGQPGVRHSSADQRGQTSGRGRSTRRRTGYRREQSRQQSEQ